MEDVLLIGHTIEEMLMARDTVIFRLQQLGFVLSLKKSVLTPTQRVGFLGVTVDSLFMTLPLPDKKVSKVQKQCLELLQKTQVSILNRQLLSSTIQAVLPAQINSRYLQLQPITTVFTSIKNIGIIFQKSDSKQKLQGRTPVMDIKFENLQWLLLDSVSQSSADTNRCIQKGLGYSMSRDINNGVMAKGGTVVAHKPVRIENSKISNSDIQETEIFESSSFSNRQHHCTTLPCKNEGNRESNITESKQRNLAVSLEPPDHNYCRIPFRFFECGGRLAVSKQQGPIRMETFPKSISASLSEEGNA